MGEMDEMGTRPRDPRVLKKMGEMDKMGGMVLDGRGLVWGVRGGTEQAARTNREVHRDVHAQIEKCTQAFWYT